MTERMKNYRERMKEKGLVQVRVWVEKHDKEFVKFIGEFCREERFQKKPKKSFGRRASNAQINFAKTVAAIKNVPEPSHLYDYHISLASWIWHYKGGS